MRASRLIAVSLGAIAVAIALPSPAQNGPDSGPIARYDMRAGTTSGFGGMGSGRMNVMSMMSGGAGGQVQHELLLRLGSANGPDKGKPQADHFMPTVARLGKSVELITPTVERGPVDEVPDFSGQRREPSGRILIFWGCGEHAPQGQPVVIDLARLARGEIPAAEGLWTSSIPADWGPTLSNSKTFGRWPAEDGKYARPDSSLLGDHRVSGNYAPDINFTLRKDFMRPLAVSVTPRPSGARLLSWPAVPDTTGLVATIMGGKQGPRGDMGDMVMWSSSAHRQFGGGLNDWLSPGQVAPLVGDRTLMGPQTTQCIVPAEVIAAAPDFQLGTLTAFGPEENFAYPPRPNAPNARWDLEWTARIRHRSTSSWMEAQGMTMGTANSSMGDLGQDEPECRPRGRGLGGLLGGAIAQGGC
jgi:hypothetical protein